VNFFFLSYQISLTMPRERPLLDKSTQDVHEEFERQLAGQWNRRFPDFTIAITIQMALLKSIHSIAIAGNPSPYFANKVIEENNIDRTASWFIGDRESDIICGKLAGLNTAFLT
jgi:histidinol phosphatase-like enzyme